MSWISLLYETYENLSKADEDESRGLISVAHSTQKAHVEVTLDVDGEFVGADFVVDVLGKQKNLSETLIPVTEKSSSRSSGSAPHSLCDKLKYLAGDYKEFCGEENDKFYNDYLSQLEGWVSSQFSNDKAQAVYTYIEKRTLAKDLVEAKIFSVDEGNKLTDKWENSDVKLSAGKQADAFIRFRVIGAKSSVSAVWQDKELQKDYINYYLSKQDEKAFCYVTGDMKACSSNHPSKIRNSGDKAKLISANDTSGFTFKGRFLTSDEATTISYEVSQKAHNALKWLVAKQGERVGDKVFLLWGTHNENLPDLNEDTDDFLLDDEDDNSEYADTKFEYAERFNKAISGYKSEIDFNSKLAIIGLDAATTGRLSIIYYREYLGIQGNDLIDNIEKWHKTCEWYHRYKFKEKKLCPFYGAPSPYDIALCAYGTEQNDFLKGDDKIIANTVERILPCISDGARIPRDIVNVLVQKSFHPQNYKNINNWRKVITITCSMYKKYLYDYNEGEVVSMSIDKNSKDISYKCGRLLAVADAIESWVLRNASDEKSKDIRITNAMRYYTKFSRTPCETWRIINEKLNPYKNKLGSKGSYLYSLIGEISGSMSSEEFAEAKNLDGRMALGFDSQRQDIIEHAKQIKQAKINSQNEEEK